MTEMMYWEALRRAHLDAARVNEDLVAVGGRRVGDGRGGSAQAVHAEHLQAVHRKVAFDTRLAAVADDVRAAIEHDDRIDIAQGQHDVAMAEKALRQAAREHLDIVQVHQRAGDVGGDDDMTNQGTGTFVLNGTSTVNSSHSPALLAPV